MELFYSDDIRAGICTLNEEESVHCVRVLRHREGDVISVIDGKGTLLECSITDASPKGTSARILSETGNWGSHPYSLHIAICPTKNNDRTEWFAEKATEVGVDRISPVIGDRSERRVFKSDRLRKIVLSAAKQSLKGAVPVISEPVSVREFIAAAPADALRMIAYCFEGDTERISMKEAVGNSEYDRFVVMIGPEGDFSPEEARLAVEAGFIPVHLGPSRLRTETAAVTAAEIVYNKYCL